MPTTKTPRTRTEILQSAVRSTGGRVQFRCVDAGGSLRSDGMCTIPRGADPETILPPEATHVRCRPRGPWIALPPKPAESFPLSQLEATALHEAAHAVFGFHHGFDVREVRILHGDRPDKPAGVTRAMPPAFTKFGADMTAWPEADLKLSVTYLVVGPAMLEEFHPREDDLIRAAEIIEHLSGGDVEKGTQIYARCRAAAVRFIIANRDAIWALAAELQAAPGRCLSGSDLIDVWNRVSARGPS